MANLKNWESEAERMKPNTLTLLKWDEMKWCEFMEKTGKQFLQLYIPFDPERIDQLVADAAFWRWWRMNWYHRDKCFEIAGPILPYNERLKYYKTVHDPENVITEINTESYVLGINYAHAIKTPIK